MEIIADLLKWGKENYVELRDNFSQYKDIFQYVHSNAFREIYCSTERRGFNLKSTFHIILKACKDKKNIECLGKNLQNYENVHNETSVYEPINKSFQWDRSKTFIFIYERINQLSDNNPRKKKSVLRFGIIIRLWVEVVRVKSLHVKSRVSWDEFRIK